MSTAVGGLMMLCMAMLLGVPVTAQTTSSKDAPSNAHLAKKPATVQQDPGERAFQANCGRCHKPPEQLSPRISGTVVRHMRVRASLSAADEKAILRFLAP
jgi:hypothetical protein